MRKTIKSAVLMTTAIISFYTTSAQIERKDKSEFKERSNPFYDAINKGVKAFNQEPVEVVKGFNMDYSGIDIPKSADEFTSCFKKNPISQGSTGTCWCFSTTSFYESEIYRISKQEVKLSEPFTVYWEYVEKAKEFVNTRGKSAFGEGSETNAMARMMKKYGVLPLSSYDGLKIGQQFHDHSKMFAEMNKYLLAIKSGSAWNEQEVLGTIKSIMNFYMGEPPAFVSLNGKNVSPQDYLKNLKLNPDDYVDFMSLLEKPYFEQAEYKVADNWWRSKDYYNVPLSDFMNIIKTSIKNGYTMSIGGDVSEGGINSKLGVAMIPSYDIPSAYIDDNARQLRFSNQSTTDDHALHLVGYLEKPNGTWFLIKDSGSGGHNNAVNPGYYYFHEDYVKLKMMTITINKEAVKDILTKFPKKS